MFSVFDSIAVSADAVLAWDFVPFWLVEGGDESGGLTASDLGADVESSAFLRVLSRVFFFFFDSPSASSLNSISSSSSSFDLCFTSPATGPVFFWTLGTTALVRPPTVTNSILAPFASRLGMFFFPLFHRCLNNQDSGNKSHSTRVSTA